MKAGYVTVGFLFNQVEIDGHGRLGSVSPDPRELMLVAMEHGDAGDVWSALTDARYVNLPFTKTA